MQSDGRLEDVVDHQAMGYTRDQIRRIAAYYGSLAGSGSNSGSGSKG